MLVLTRKSQERILIGDNIKITILRVKGNAVRVGIDAPADVRVVRGELTVKASPSPTIPAAVAAITSTAEEEGGDEPDESALATLRAPLARYIAAPAHAV